MKNKQVQLRRILHLNPIYHFGAQNVYFPFWLNYLFCCTFGY